MLNILVSCAMYITFFNPDCFPKQHSYYKGWLLMCYQIPFLCDGCGHANSGLPHPSAWSLNACCHERPQQEYFEPSRGIDLTLDLEVWILFLLIWKSGYLFIESRTTNTIQRDLFYFIFHYSTIGNVQSIIAPVASDIVSWHFVEFNYPTAS